MALTKETIEDVINVVGDFKNIQIRTTTITKDDGVELTRRYHRRAIQCGTIDESDNFVATNVSGYSADVQAIANQVWTTAVKNAWKDKLRADKSTS